jgi:hypothetical protein
MMVGQGSRFYFFQAWAAANVARWMILIVKLMAEANPNLKKYKTPAAPVQAGRS